jgi:signal transduction histidine kinase
MVVREVTDRVKAQKQLEELVRSKDELVASVSHELRTPLTTVVGLAQELHDRYDSFAENERRDLLNHIVGQSTDMAELIDDLLVAARADVGMVNIDTKLIVLCKETEGVLSRWTGVKPAYSSPPEPIEVWADPFRFRQIVRNLLANADRYGREPVEIELTVFEKRGRMLVRDAGPGLPEQRWEEIFHPYMRAHERPGVPASVGLGLTVSRQLARLMGGDLFYRVDEGRSTFCLDLPMEPAANKSQAEG